MGTAPTSWDLTARSSLRPDVWRASGHVEHFTDALVECRSCHRRFKADDLGANCPHCGASDFTETRQFNTMFKTFVGPVEDDASVAYLRPETCQMIYLNFRNVQLAARMKLPFGIAQIGKAFRNEITPGNFIFRTREFEQMELEYFVKPDMQRSGSTAGWRSGWHGTCGTGYRPACWSGTRSPMTSGRTTRSAR